MKLHCELFLMQFMMSSAQVLSLPLVLPLFRLLIQLWLNLEGAVNNLPSSSNSNNISSFEPKLRYSEFIQASPGKNRICSAYLKLKYDYAIVPLPVAEM